MGRCAVLIAFYEDNSSLWCLFERNSETQGQEQDQSGITKTTAVCGVCLNSGLAASQEQNQSGGHGDSHPLGGNRRFCLSATVRYRINSASQRLKMLFYYYREENILMVTWSIGPASGQDARRPTCLRQSRRLQ